MLIHPINSANICFGRKEKQQQRTYALPGAVAGTAVGLGFSHFNSIKINKENIEESIDIIDKKLAKSIEQNDTFTNIKNTFLELKNHKDSQLKKMGVTPNLKEVSLDSVLNGFVCNEEKSLYGLDCDIEWAKGEASSFKNENKKTELAKKLEEINEKNKIKELATTANNSPNKVIKVSDLEAYYDSTIKNNTKIKKGLDEFSSLIKGFNRRRLVLFSLLGLIGGSIIGNTIKTNSKK